MTVARRPGAFAPVLLTGLSLLVAGPARAGEDSGKTLAALEQKLRGDWVGSGPCDGQLTLKADGTYERRRYGPAGNNSSGGWEVRWDALPPTLILSCKTSDDPAYAGKALEVKVLQLDDGNLVFQYEKEAPARYTRGKKQHPAGSGDKEDGATRDELLGGWRSVEVTLTGGQSDLELRPDGTFDYQHLDVGLGWKTTISGTWEGKGARLILTAAQRREDGREAPVGPKKTEELSATRRAGVWILISPDGVELQKAAKGK